MKDYEFDPEKAGKLKVRIQRPARWCPRCHKKALIDSRRVPYSLCLVCGWKGKN